MVTASRAQANKIHNRAAYGYSCTAPAPKNAMVVEDPANIIFANSGNNLFVESIAGFQSDCAAFGAQASILLDLAAVQVFNNVQAAADGQGKWSIELPRTFDSEVVRLTVEGQSGRITADLKPIAG